MTQLCNFTQKHANHCHLSHAATVVVVVVVVATVAVVVVATVAVAVRTRAHKFAWPPPGNSWMKS